MLGKIRSVTRSSMLGKLLISYLLVLTIPLCGLAINFIYSNSTIKKEVYATNRQILDAAVLRADDALYQLAYTAQKVCGADAVKMQASLQSNMKHFYWKLPETIAVVNALEKTIYSEEILVYLHDQEYMITRKTSGLVRMLGASMKYIDSSPYSINEYADAMRAVSYVGRYELNDIYTYSHVDVPLLTYMLTYRTPNHTLKNRDMTVFVSMPVETLMDLCGFSGEQSGLFVVLDENYGVLLQSDETIKLPSNMYRYLEEDNKVSVKLGNEKYLGCLSDSSVNGWHYIMLSPGAQFWAGRNMLYIMCLLALAAALLTGVAISVVQSRKNYLPIARTMDLMNAKAREGENEFSAIQNAWLRMQNEKQMIERTLTSRSDLFRKHYLLSYIQGADSMLPDTDMNPFFGINPENKRFALLGFMPASGNTDEEDALKREMCFSRTGDLFARLFMEDCIAINLQSSQIQLWLLIMEPEQAEFIFDRMDEKLPLILEEGRAILGLGLSGFITEPVDAPENLRAGYAGMMSYMEYQYVINDTGIVHLTHQDLSGVSGPAVVLTEALRSGRYMDARDLIDSMLPGGDVLTEKLTAFDILKSIYTAMSASIEKAGFERAVNAVSSAAAPEDVREALDVFIRNACGIGETEEQSASGEDELSRKLEQYVLEHYTEMNLSLATIGADFGLTPKYLSTLYKSRTGRSLLDFINMTRIARAQELLSEPRMTVTQAAEMVGYASVKTFRRAYLRIVGENPGKGRGEETE